MLQAFREYTETGFSNQRLVTTGPEALHFMKSVLMGLFRKWSTLDLNHFNAIPYQKLVFLISLYPGFLEKKQRNKKS